MRATTAIRTLARRAMPIVFGVAALFCAACVAAVLAHCAIDVAGDYLLRHDTYDHIGHVSRSIATLVAAVFALASAVVFLAAAVADARRFRGALASVLGSSGLRSPLRLALAIVPTAFIVLVAMESIDGRVATGVQPGLASALGGSIVLGTSAVLATGASVAIALWRGLRALSASQRRITSALGRLISRRAVAGSNDVSRHAWTEAPADSIRGSILSRRAGKRDPPQAA